MADFDEQQVRTRLEQRVTEIETTREKMRKESEGGSELADYDQHPGDKGTEMHDQELDQTTELLLDDERSRIAEAVSVLDAGTYGKCVVCSKDIPAARLEAMPEAVRCIEHQRELEAQGRIAYVPPSER